jgi:glyoxylase-like metal-dependent hydrolase (beta-lactamase superfamily II)
MAQTPILTLDLHFQGQPHAIASYLIRYSDGAVLIESGPGSTQAGLQAALAREGFSPRDVTHVLLTHIHLDHAGAAGWLARQGAEIYVHPLGAPHMINPEKLLASAARLYGDKMESLWGEFLPVPEQKLRVPNNAEEIKIGNLRFIPISTAGHTAHHYAYRFEDLCFSGDIGGVRIPGYQYLQVPMVPPELHLERWHEDMRRLRQEKFARIAPTHFGIYDDPEWQLRQVEKGLDEAACWMEKAMQADPSIEELRRLFIERAIADADRIGISQEVWDAYELANPSSISADGLLRYWKKIHRAC